MHFPSGCSSFQIFSRFSPGSISTLTLGVKNLILLTGEIYLVIGFTLVLIFMFSNPLAMLIRLFIISLTIAYIFSMKSSWIRLLFIIVYIGGVLVLAIYLTLSSSNWRFPPTIVFLFILLLSFQGNLGHSFYSGDSLGESLRIIIALLVLLLFSLFLIIKLIK